MTDHDALLQAIISNPEDDLPRLVFADWLEERGRPLRAELIRVQIEIARASGQGEAAALRVREDAIFAEDPLVLWPHHDDESMPTPWGHSHWPHTSNRDFFGPIYRRGFVDEVMCPWEHWRGYGSRVCEVEPVRKVRLTTRPTVEIADLRTGDTHDPARRRWWLWAEWFVDHRDGSVPEQYRFDNSIDERELLLRRVDDRHSYFESHREHFRREVRLRASRIGYLRHKWPTVKTWRGVYPLPEPPTAANLWDVHTVPGVDGDPHQYVFRLDIRSNEWVVRHHDGEEERVPFTGRRPSPIADLEALHRAMIGREILEERQRRFIDRLPMTVAPPTEEELDRERIRQSLAVQDMGFRLDPRIFTRPAE